ncbi:MAG: outer membrane protein assembly factor BamD [Oscillatoria sp. Prado101]|jgi:tetratricopeptide (TPR) repeat protein|nr:outer membrane protein assembly factor BamD [Oscillatoria sp. Prado101]
MARQNNQHSSRKANSYDSDIPQTNIELNAGLAALKRGDWASAIGYLEYVCDLELHQPTLYKAQMNLAIAYIRNGEILKAKPLCQNLAESNNAKVKEWATSTIADLAERYPELFPEAQSGKEFVYYGKQVAKEYNTFFKNTLDFVAPIFSAIGEIPAVKKVGSWMVAEIDKRYPNRAADALYARQKAGEASTLLWEKGRLLWQSVTKIIERVWPKVAVWLEKKKPPNE